MGLSLGEGDNQVEDCWGYHWVRGIIRWRLLGLSLGEGDNQVETIGLSWGEGDNQVETVGVIIG